MGKLETFSLYGAERDSFIERYEQFYLKKEVYTEDEKNLLGTIIINKTVDVVEKYADSVLSEHLLDKRVFLWKAGRLEPKDAECKDSIELHQIKVKNGRGREIENAESFIDAANAIGNDLKNNIDGFEDDYKTLLEISKQNKLKNVGAVYLITVLFFLSNKEYPIYDFFAHRAVKALYLGKKPVDVFVGAAPEKTELDKVFAMYKEYIFLLNQVFGYHSIERKLDRALWVYGHSKNMYHKST